MPHLYQALTWTIDEPSRPREYVIHDDGQVLANVSRVAVQRPEDTAMPYANPHTHHDDSRIVLCVAAPDGAPYFYVDRTHNPTHPQPAFVVAPNGGLIGSVAVDTGGVKGVFGLVSGRREPATPCEPRTTSPWRSWLSRHRPTRRTRAPSPPATAARSPATRSPTRPTTREDDAVRSACRATRQSPPTHWSSPR